VNQVWWRNPKLHSEFGLEGFFLWGFFFFGHNHTTFFLLRPHFFFGWWWTQTDELIRKSTVIPCANVYSPGLGGTKPSLGFRPCPRNAVYRKGDNHIYIWVRRAQRYDVPNVAKIKSEENFCMRKKTFRCEKTFFWSELRMALYYIPILCRDVIQSHRNKPRVQYDTR
jgi:hypothetical protein